MTTLERLSSLLVRHYKLDPARLAPDQPLELLGIDSLAMVEMLLFIEDEFAVRLPPDAGPFTTLAEAARCLDGLLAAQSGRPGPSGAATETPPGSPDRTA